jgi:hypothetical protein
VVLSAHWAQALALIPSQFGGTVEGDVQTQSPSPPSSRVAASVVVSAASMLMASAEPSWCGDDGVPHAATIDVMPAMAEMAIRGPICLLTMTAVTICAIGFH